MHSRLAFERADTLSAEARKRCAAAVEQAGKVKKAATDAAFAARDAVFDRARDAHAAARRARPRDEAEVARCEQAVRDAKAACKVAPDLSQINAEHAAATKAADDVLTAELREIRRRLRKNDPFD